MHYLFFFALSVLLVVVQTALFPDFFHAVGFYDLIIPLSIYFSLYRSLAEGLPVMLATGIMMDMISGAPIGVYLTVYLWLFIALRPAWRWVSVTQHFFFPVIVVLGVLFENAAFWTAISIQSGTPAFASSAFKVLFLQSAWALFTAPVLLIIFNFLFRTADNIGNAMKENGQF